ncbi:MAG TPA: high-affinity branched-chain amino acid ABC transporter ATP-binding protein LivG [Deltaproteobacteria bacterium]|nr:MAG: high-affinity branched-chain amino acid ABC transporter ATP-binding protein LivG [Deltaproteobacteria bacterium GWC2_65_14]HBO69228.1 high-affinity branched-chain amino acid ABC transporter ATP-binding protein LivG [Deltaproteobacteria bacterium]
MLLSVRGVSKNFGGVQAVDDVSFDVPGGAIKALIGPNGAGKTTLFNLVSGFLPPQQGSIVFDGEEMRGLPPHRIAARGMTRTFQQIRLFPKMSVLETVMVGAHVHSRGEFLAGMLHLPFTRKEERRVREECREILGLLGIDKVADDEATSLPYGLQRVVELGRALACKPRILLLDEPAAGLNISETTEMGKRIARIRGEMGITVLLVEHDMALVMDISDEIVVLSYGKKIAEDVPKAIQRNREVIRVYLGENDA